jgi:hypothetical protein
VLPARSAASSLALVFVLLTAALLPAACGGGGAATETASEPEVDDEALAEVEPARADGAEWSGWRWKGKRQECFFRYRNRCFDNLAAACRAAGCQESRCSRDDGAPAVVRCRK